ncbi:MAG TPA: IS1595 family transposase [Solirubrobacterales bacterium]|nr:IS1595 family transposase [Solirubrobacterales bacterium]
MNLPDLIEQFRSEEKCREYLEDLRWPDGVRCPRCGCGSTSWIAKREQHECNEPTCRYQFSVKAGTVFHDSHLPLWKWFLAIYLIGESKKGISAKQLQRTLGVSYKTAWYLGHRVRSAMEEDSPVPLKGIVEIDETWIGGYQRRSKGTPTSNKKMVLGAISRGGEVRFEMREGPGLKSKVTYRSFVEANVDGRTELILTDSANSWGDMNDFDTAHEKVDHSREEWVRGIVHTNTIEGVWSLFKRSVVGTYHQLSAKHLPAYLDEMAFRFNNRENAFLFRDTLLRMIHGETLPYAELIADDA